MLGFVVVLAYTTLHTAGGTQLHWNPATAPYSINAAGSPDIPDDSDTQAVKASFDAWNAAANFHYHTDCLTNLNAGSIHPGNEVNDGNSIVTWVNSNWVYGNGTIAITFNWFDPTSGEIGESDLMANGQDYTWTTGSTGVQTDVRNFLTHEAGHYLGMDHSLDTEATMFATGTTGETKKRDLDADDIAGVQSIYGAGSTADSGTPMQCSSGSTPKSCGCDLSRSGTPWRGAAGVLLSLGAVGIAFALRRKRGVALLLGVAIIGFAGSAHATAMRDLSLVELTHDADSVVVGTVESSQVVTDGQTIRTVTRVVVHEVLAGHDYGTALDVWTPGGELPAGVAGPNGYRGLVTTGLPHFLAGEEVVVFGMRLAGDPANTLRVSNLAQGKMSVVRNGAHTSLQRDLSGVMRVVRNADGSFDPAPEADPLGELTLDQLRTSLRTLPTR